MYTNVDGNTLSNSVFLCVRNTPYFKLNTNSFRRKLLSIVEDYINSSHVDDPSRENATDSIDEFNECVINSENYSVHFLLPNIPEQSGELCSLYGFNDFKGMYLFIIWYLGVFALRNFLSPDQCLLLACETLRSYINPPSNSNLLVKDPSLSPPLWPSEAFKSLRWSTIGHLYDWGKRQYDGFTEFPEIIVKVINEVNKILSNFYESFTADSAIINFYSRGYFLRLHRDDAEETDDPVINISLGAPAIFSICQQDPNKFPLSCVVDCGSVIIMSNNSRRCLHGISKLLNYVKPDSEEDDGSETIKDTENPFAKPYFIGNFPKCSDKVFEGFTTPLDDEQISNVKDYLSTSRISLSVRKAKF